MNPRIRGVSGPRTRQAAGIVLVTAALFALISWWRFSEPGRFSGAAFLYVIPITLLAVRFGYRGVLAGGLTALGLTAWWTEIHAGIPLAASDYLMRIVAFVVVAGVLGWQVERRKALEGESDRWFDLSDELCCVVGLDGRFTRVNASWQRHLGYTEGELLGEKCAAFVHPDDLELAAAEIAALAARPYAAASFESRSRAKNGRWHWLLWSCRADDKRIYAAARDITDRKELEARLNALAREDKLTGLPNRRAWSERAGEELARARRSGEPLAVAMLDMDELKHVNDTRGHDAGDSLLVACAMAWEEALRGCDFLARIGGDEFALLLPGCEAEEAAAIIDRVREACEDVRFSAGIATLSGSDSARTLLSRADEALYRAKADGRGISAVAR